MTVKDFTSKEAVEGIGIKNVKLLKLDEVTEFDLLYAAMTYRRYSRIYFMVYEVDNSFIKVGVKQGKPYNNVLASAEILEQRTIELFNREIPNKEIEVVDVITVDGVNHKR